MPRLLALLLACFPAQRAQPEIAPDRRVTFRLLAPKASEVTLSGEFLKANAPLHKDDKGLWIITFWDQHHVQHVFHESPGAHTWIVWRPYLNELAPLLFR